MNVTEIHHRGKPLEQKEPEPIGHLGEKEVRQEDPSCWKWLTSFFVAAPSVPLLPPDTFKRPEIVLDRAVISQLTDEYVGKLQTSSQPHLKLLTEWIENLYRNHGFWLSKNSGLDTLDADALYYANAALNPVVMEEIQKLIAHSETIKTFYEGSLKYKMPLSSYIYWSDQFPNAAN